MMDRMQGPSVPLSRATSMPCLSEPCQEDGEREPISLAFSQADSRSDFEGEEDLSRGYRLTLDDVGDILKVI